MLTLALQDEHERAIRTHSQQAYPYECCGFLLGRDHRGEAGDPGGRRQIVRVVEAANDRGEGERHNRFAITPRDFMIADKAARAAGLDVLGFYHSHPDAPARPSAYDLEHAWPVYSYIIVAVDEGQAAKMTCWVLADDRKQFVEQPVLLPGRPSTSTGQTAGKAEETL